MSKVKAIPEGFHTVTPSLTVSDIAKAIDFYKKAFGAEERVRMPGPDGRLMHAELRIGNSALMLGGEMPNMGAKSPKALAGSAVTFFIYTENVDTAWDRAAKAGAKTVMPLEKMFWGDRAGCVEDADGHKWWLAQHVEDLTPDEILQRQEMFFAHL